MAKRRKNPDARVILTWGGKHSESMPLRRFIADYRVPPDVAQDLIDGHSLELQGGREKVVARLERTSNPRKLSTDPAAVRARRNREMLRDARAAWPPRSAPDKGTVVYNRSTDEYEFVVDGKSYTISDLDYGIAPQRVVLLAEKRWAELMPQEWLDRTREAMWKRADVLRMEAEARHREALECLTPAALAQWKAAGFTEAEAKEWSNVLPLRDAIVARQERQQEDAMNRQLRNPNPLRRKRAPNPHAKGDVNSFLTNLRGLLTQYDQKLEAQEIKRRGRVNIYRLGLFFEAADRVEADVRKYKHRADPEALEALRRSLLQRFTDFPVRRTLLKQIDSFEATGRLPRYAKLPSNR